MKEDKPTILSYRSFYTPLSTIEKFHNYGYDTVCVFPAHTLNSIGTPYSQYPPTWLWYDKVDFSPFDKMVEDVSLAMPNAKLVCMIDLNAPIWLIHKNELSVCDTYNNLGNAVHNPIWIEATENYLKKFVEYANEKYGDRILAYLMVAGSTDEWYDRSNGSDSPERAEAWRKYQISKGKPDPVDIPGYTVRERVSFDNFLRDPDKEGIAVDYWRFCNESIADTIIRFSKIVRGIIQDKAEIGAFYGYVIDNDTVCCGHLAYEKVLDCDSIDYLISPGSYCDRKIGGGSGFLIPNGSARVRGKRLFHECDQRTHTYNSFIDSFKSFKFEHWENEEASIAGIKREASLGLIKRTHLWWFDMWGGFYEGEKIMQTLSKVKNLWEEITPLPAVDSSEVCLIVDPDSSYYTNYKGAYVGHLNQNLRNNLSRLGASYEVYSFNDIPKIKDFDKYKFVVFSMLLEVTEEKLKILNKYVLNNNRNILWLYAPGIIRNGKLDVNNCEILSGIPYGEKEVVKIDMGKFVSWYAIDDKLVPPSVLKEIAKNAGVTINVEPEIPVYAEGDLIAVHTKDGGEIAVTVDKKYTAYEELFTGKKGTIINGKFTYDFNTPDTALFRLIK